MPKPLNFIEGMFWIAEYRSDESRSTLGKLVLTEDPLDGKYKEGRDLLMDEPLMEYLKGVPEIPGEIETVKQIFAYDELSPWGPNRLRLGTWVHSLYSRDSEGYRIAPKSGEQILDANIDLPDNVRDKKHLDLGSSTLYSVNYAIFPDPIPYHPTGIIAVDLDDIYNFFNSLKSSNVTKIEYTPLEELLKPARVNLLPGIIVTPGAIQRYQNR